MSAERMIQVAIARADLIVNDLWPYMAVILFAVVVFAMATRKRG